MDKKMLFPYLASVIAIVATIFCFINSLSRNAIDNVTHSIEFKLDEDFAPLLASLLSGNSSGEDGRDGKDGKDGLPGKNGLDGKSVEFSVENNVLCWRYVGETKWRSLYEFGVTDDSIGGDSNNGLDNSGDSDNSGESSENEDNSNHVPTSQGHLVTSVSNTTTPNCLTDGSQCSIGTAMTVKVNNFEEVLFYVVGDSNGVLTLIADHNVNPSESVVPWSSTKTVINGTAIGHSTNYGPIDAMMALNTLTASWTNINYINEYDYTNYGEGSTTTGGYKQISIKDGYVTIVTQDGHYLGKDGYTYIKNEQGDYQSDKADSIISADEFYSLDVRARTRMLTYNEANSVLKYIESQRPPELIEGEEVVSADGDDDEPIVEEEDTSNSIDLDFMTKNLDNDKNTPEGYGYWLLSSSSSSKASLFVYSGSIRTNAPGTVDTATPRGVRPVITLQK